MANNNILSVYYQNCRGLKTKLHTLFMNILANSYDIIILTETWLHLDIYDNELIDSRYHIFRKDRDRVATGRRDGGGVLIAIQRSLKATLHSGSLSTSAVLPSTVDHIILNFQIHKQSYIICATYIPPNQNYDTYDTYFNYLQEVLLESGNSTNVFWIAGDFNLPNLNWTAHDSAIYALPSNVQSSSDQCLMHFMSILNCFQLNTIKNKHSRILDLFFTNEPNSTTTTVSVPLVPIDEHHPPFNLLIPLQNDFMPCPSKPYIKYIYDEADYSKIKSELLGIDWNSQLLDKSPESAVSFLYENLYSVIKKHVPTKTIKKSSFPIWFTPSLIRLFNKKTKLWLKMKKFSSESNYGLYSAYRKLFKDESEKCYRKYQFKVEDSIKINIKYFWTYISNRKNSSNIPSSMQYKTLLANSPSDICKLFSDYFLSVFEQSTIPDQYDINNIVNSDSDINTPDDIITHIVISKPAIQSLLKSLDVNKGAGVDNIPAVFLKPIADVITDPVYIILNKCLTHGVFPRIWKTARIVPVHKGGSKKDIENYRPTSILPALSKVFEKLVHQTIYPTLHKVILPQQHGFVKHRSTLTNMTIFVTSLLKGFEANKQTDSIYTDFRKAFDRVDHKILLDKIAYNGIRGNLWRWFKSYITNRTQKVVVNGYESDLVPVSSGVPQGSILGPLLFILFINDIDKCFNQCKFLLYADDLKIFHTVNDVSDYSKIQSDLDRLTTYCNQNKLELSVNKCKIITFTKKRKIINYPYKLCGTTLTRTNNIRDLGITLDSKLHLDTHVENIINKAFKMYGFVVRSCEGFKSTFTYLYIYKALIRSQLEYLVPIWNPLYQKYIDKIEMVQKKYLRCIHFKCTKQRLSYDQLLVTYMLLDLQSRRKQLETMFLYDLCNDKYDCTEIVNQIFYSVPRTSQRRSTQSHRLFFGSICRTNAGVRSPLHRMFDTYNNYFYTIDIFSVSVGTYRKLILDILKTWTSE